MSILGKRFRDAGLKDICIEAGIVAEGSINGVLDGKHYNRAIRVHKYIYEALMRLVWEEFLLWAEDNQEASTTIEAFVDKVNSMVCDVNQEEFDDMLDSPLLAKLVTLWSDFLEYLRHNNGELSTYWMSYIDIVESVVLGLLRASHEGNWCLHLSAIQSMIAWCFSYDKVKYARYLSARTAPRDIASDLMKAHEIGEQCYSNFKEERLEKDSPAKQFHDPIPANKLKTFSKLCKKKEVKSSGRVIILKADRSLFGRIIVMAQVHNLKMEDILSHPLGLYPGLCPHMMDY